MLAFATAGEPADLEQFCELENISGRYMSVSGTLGVVRQDAVFDSAWEAWWSNIWIHLVSRGVVWKLECTPFTFFREAISIVKIKSVWIQRSRWASLPGAKKKSK
ncbi:hypothetical protein [Pseudomonas sp. NPDC089569]|uniref:hypothetical protein n=1 Tax=Pseudomonas sp. NPDC089569 TaxID=3390722 RepID=UPI003CFF4707